MHRVTVRRSCPVRIRPLSRVTDAGRRFSSLSFVAAVSRLPRTKTHLRFELHPEDRRIWRKAADSLGAKEGRLEWVFGQDDALARDMVARRGYALLVRCETQGIDRRVHIGTVTDGKRTPWAPLEQCRMTEGGLVTPALEELRVEGAVCGDGIGCESYPGSVALPSGQTVFAVDVEAAPLSSSPLDVPGRRLVPGFVKPAGSRIVRACLSLPDSVPAPTDQYVYRFAGPVRLLVTDAVEGSGSSWAVRADALVQLKGLDVERTGLWRPRVALDEKYAPAPRASSACERTPLIGAAAIGPKAPDAPSGKTADELRKVLEGVAAKGATVTWSELTERLGRWVHDLPNPTRRELLVEVDEPRVPGEPLLSVLVVTHLGRPLSYFGDVLSRLGAVEPASAFALQQWAAAETKKTHQAYGHRRTPASAAPPPRLKQPSARVQAPSEGDLRWAQQRRAQIGQKVKEAEGTRVRAKGGSCPASVAGDPAGKGVLRAVRRSPLPWAGPSRLAQGRRPRPKPSRPSDRPSDHRRPGKDGAADRRSRTAGGQGPQAAAGGEEGSEPPEDPTPAR